jgi:hypothetical protein
MIVIDTSYLMEILKKASLKTLIQREKLIAPILQEYEFASVI